MIKRRIALAATSAMLVGGGTLAAAVPAWADYGPGAVYQIELSANVAGPQGGGVWLWIELNRDGAGDYRGSDCGHGLGAVRDSGDVSWTLSPSGDQVIITSVALNGLGGFPATVTVPAKTGHYTGTVGTFITLPAFIPAGAGFSQLQVAP
jgi:hypothetical protein